MTERQRTNVTRFTPVTAPTCHITTFLSILSALGERVLFMKMLLGLALAATAAVAVAATKSEVTASNGVAVTVYSDEFANRYEYSAPSIEFKEDGESSGSFALVAKISKGGAIGDAYVTGAVYYSGDWHRYASAVFRGGDTVKFTSTSRDVLSCRYGCSYSEGFRLDISKDEIAKHASDGVLAVQLRAQSSDTAIIQIPVSYFDAVNEVAKR